MKKLNTGAMQRAHDMTQAFLMRYPYGERSGIDYRVTFAAALRICHRADRIESAADDWNDMTPDAQFEYLRRATWYEYHNRDTTLPDGTPRFDFFSWIHAPEDQLEDVAQEAYIRLVDLLARGKYRDRPLSTYMSKAIQLAAETIRDEHVRNAQPLKCHRDRDTGTEEWYHVLNAAPLAEPIAPDPYTYVAVRDTIESCCRDDIDREIVRLLTPPGVPTQREIAAAVGLSHVAVGKRIKAIRARYQHEDRIAAVDDL